jgi:adenylate kinase family enzyme
MRISVTGPSGSGKTWVSAELARRLGLRHVELDALHHGPNWESCGAEVLRERVLEATQGEDWVTDGTYHAMLGDLVLERTHTLVWLDLPVPLVMWRLLRRTRRRIKHRIVLWSGNVEDSWRESLKYLIWPAFTGAFKNRRTIPRGWPATRT